MAIIFPSGIQPFIFSDTLPAGTIETSQAALDQHITAFIVADFSSAVPPGATRLVVTFVVFAFPTPHDPAPPSPPVVELLGRGVAFDGPGLALRQTLDGTASATIGNGQFVNYSYRPLGRGVFQIALTPNNVPLDTVRWQIRFAINDGVTSSKTQLGLTFTVGTEEGGVGWLAVPGQAALASTGPAAIDVGGAAAGITLAGAHAARPVPTGQNVTVAIPLGNYGTAPLTISACTPPTAGSFDVALPTPLVLPPGGSGSVTLTYRPPDAGETQDPAAATVFTLVSDDPLAAPHGASAHFNTLAFHATSIGIPSLVPPPQFAPLRGVPALEFEDGELLVCEITILGRNLHVGNVSASFGDVPAESIRFSPDGLILGVPAIAPGRVRVTVSTGGGSVTSTDLLTISPHPEITDLDPFTFGDHGDSPAGRLFAILGSGFIIQPGDTVRASAVLNARFDGVHQVESEFVALDVLAATATRLDVRAGAAPNFFRYIGGTVTIRVHRSDGGAAETTSVIEGL